MSGEIVGSILLGDDGKPFFKVVNKHDRGKDAGPNVRPCEHGKFTLDEKWSTVTCDFCGERIDPFRALIFFCNRWEEFEQKRNRMIEAEKSLAIESLRKLRGRKDATHEDHARIDALLSRRWSATLDEVKTLYDELHKLIDERKWARKRAVK